MNNFFDNQRIIQLIWRRKYHFFIVGIVAVVLSAVFSGPRFIKPKYKSTARIYPINLDVLSEESETEQMVEILNSRDLKLKMFDAFSLSEVYRISPDEPYYMTYMLDIYNKNVSAGKTKFETAEIKVLDYIPQRASDMCDSIIHFYNEKVSEMYRIKYQEMVKISKDGLDKNYAKLDTLVTQLDSLRREYGVLDYNSQVERVTEGYMNALAGGNTPLSNTKEIQKIYNNLAKKGTHAVWLESQHKYLLSNIDSLTTEYDFYLSEYTKDITYSHVIEYPTPADKKSYPIRWLIVVFSTVSAVFFALLVFLVFDYRKKE